MKELYKFIWSDDKLTLSDNIHDDPGVIHHHQLFEQTDYKFEQPYVMGEYYGGNNLEIEWRYGDNLPTWQELLEQIKETLYGSHNAAVKKGTTIEKYFIELQKLATPIEEVNLRGSKHDLGHEPFVYNPASGRLFRIDGASGYHYDIISQLGLHELVQGHLIGEYIPGEGVYLYNSGGDMDEELKERGYEELRGWAAARYPGVPILGGTR